MNRFYVDEQITGKTVSVSSQKQLHHLKNVLRLKAGDEVMVFDKEGNEFIAAISSLESKGAVLALKEKKLPVPRKVKISIACAIPKQSRMDDIMDKLTQLGVDQIIPLVTERVLIKAEEVKDTRVVRWNKIVRSAAEQSGRNVLPVISSVMDLSEVLKQAAEYDLKLLPTLTENGRPIKEVLTGTSPASILAIIGPEGDFSPREVQSALEGGFYPVSLGSTILRVETAAIAVASYLRLVYL